MKSGSSRHPSPLAHAIAGAVGAVLAMAVLYPLDQVRTILQVDDNVAAECAGPDGGGIVGALTVIVRRNGRSALWRGMVPVLITMGTSNFVYFYCFSTLKVCSYPQSALIILRSKPYQGLSVPVPAQGDINQSVRRGLTPLESTAASTISGIVNVLTTTPLWVSNLRIKAGRGKGNLFSTMADIGYKEGVGALWSGVAPSLLLVLNPIIQFVVYENLKQALQDRSKALILIRGGGAGVGRG
ncbi:unnamed protein product, partial [Choristocarpus tenellus]